MGRDERDGETPPRPPLCQIRYGGGDPSPGCPGNKVRAPGGVQKIRYGVSPAGSSPFHGFYEKRGENQLRLAQPVKRGRFTRLA